MNKPNVSKIEALMIACISILTLFYCIKLVGNHITTKRSKAFLNQDAFPLKSDAWFQEHLSNYSKFKNQPRHISGYLNWSHNEFKSSTINTSRYGYRLSGECSRSWPPSPLKNNIFIFGGSRAFGYGVADDQAMSFLIEKSLNEGTISRNGFCSYNFAQAGYMPEQVLSHVLHLSAIGALDNSVIIYMDGVNEGENPFPESIDLKGAYIRKSISFGHSLSSFVKNRVLGSLKSDPINYSFLTSDDFDKSISVSEHKYLADVSYNRFCGVTLALKSIVESKNSIFVRVLEPNPSFPSHKKHTKFRQWNRLFDILDGADRQSNYFYEYARGGCKEWPVDLNFLDLSDFAPAFEASAYSDWAHYSPALNAAISAKIVEILKLEYGNTK